MTDLIVRKAQELSFALLKVAAYIRRFELRQRIEKLSYHLLENISYQNPEVAIATIAALRNFVVLGKNVYEIEPKNALILERELDMLYKEIKHFAGMGDSVDVEQLFTVSLPINKSKETNRVAPVKISTQNSQPKIIGSENSEWQFHIPEEIFIQDSEVGDESAEQAIPAVKEYGNHNAASNDTARERQERMIAMIAESERQLQLKDFIAAFPELSERTIRYDLKKLADLGKIVRQGSGGPGNYYRLT